MSFFERNRNRLRYASAFACVSIVGYVAVKKILNKGMEKLESFSQNMEQSLQQSLQLSKFKQSELNRLKSDSVTIVNSFLPLFASKVKQVTDPKPITNDLRNLRASKMPKNSEEEQACWEKLKVTSITRLFASIYGVTLLHTLIAVQQHIISRNNLQNDQNLSKEFNENVISQSSKYFFDQGLHKLTNKVQEIVIQITSSWKMGTDQKVYVEEIIDMLYAFRKAFEPDETRLLQNKGEFKPSHASTFMMASPASTQSVIDSSQDQTPENDTLNEIFDLVECPVFDFVAASALDSVFDVVVKNLIRFKKYGFLSPGNRDADGKLVLTKVIVALMKEIGEDIISLEGNQYLEAIKASNDSKVFGEFASDIFQQEETGDQDMMQGLEQMMSMFGGGDDDLMKMFNGLSQTQPTN